MPRANLAERMLAIVTTSSHAASIVGDLEEEASNRTSLWFWLSLLRVLIAHIFQDLRIHWLRMIWLGFSEFLIFVIAAMLVESTTRSYAAAEYLGFCIPILLGWHAASRFHGHELASGFSFVFALWTFKAVEMLPIFWIPVEKLPMPWQGNPFMALMYSILRLAPFNTLTIVGALLCRCRMNVRCRKHRFS